MTIKEFVYSDQMVKVFGPKRRIEATLTEIRKRWPSGFPDVRTELNENQVAHLLFILSATAGTKDVAKAIQASTSYNTFCKRTPVLLLQDAIYDLDHMHEVDSVFISHLDHHAYFYYKERCPIAPKYRIIKFPSHSPDQEELDIPRADIGTRLDQFFLSDIWSLTLDVRRKKMMERAEKRDEEFRKRGKNK